MVPYLALVLHAHLPFVRHPEAPRYLEEDWLYQALSESYLPLLLAFDRLARDGLSFRLTVSFSPTVLSMVRDELLMSRFRQRLDEWCELAEKEVSRTWVSERGMHPVARFYRDRFETLRHAFVETYRGDILQGFQALQRAGYLDLITTAATHAFLPLLRSVPGAVGSQVSIGANVYRETFGENPLGFWLPECGYFPGLERFLAAEDLRFFFLDTHGLELAQPEPLDGVYAPVFTDCGVAAFGRDPRSSEQLWDARRGFPGDPWYREYYRDIGWSLSAEYLGPYLQHDGSRKNTGFKYFRITGRTEEKLPYEPEQARRQAVEHAAEFLVARAKHAAELASLMERPPLFVAPYDAELFGHWWFEGPIFLEALIRATAADPSLCALVTPADYLERHPELQLVTPSFSSWGAGGYSEMWLNEATDWLYQPLLRCAVQMNRLAREFDHQAPPLVERALNQAARELLLAQSSDWAFIMKTGTMAAYAKRRAAEHLETFLELSSAIRQSSVDPVRLGSIEAKNNLFPKLDFRVFGRELK